MKKIILACALLVAAIGAKAQRPTLIIEPGLPPWLTPLNALFYGDVPPTCTPVISAVGPTSIPAGPPITFTAATTTWAGGVGANYFNRLIFTYGSGPGTIYLTVNLCTLPAGRSTHLFSDGITPLVIDNLSDLTQYRINIHN
jgi:hypothetical protein